MVQTEETQGELESGWLPSLPNSPTTKVSPSMQPSRSTPKRIALTIHALFGGGAERLMAQLASRWSEAGHEVHLVTWSTTETDKYRVPRKSSDVG